MAPSPPPFTLWDPTRTASTPLPIPPTKIPSHRFNIADWTPPVNTTTPSSPINTSLYRHPILTSIQEVIADPLGYCKICSLNNCGAPCLARFRQRFLTDEQIDIKGPYALGNGAFLAPGVQVKTGDFVGEYLGQLIPSNAIVSNSMYITAMTGNLVNHVVESVADIDAERHGNWTRFINSHCIPNLRAESISVGQQWLVVLIATKDVSGGKELCFNYGWQYFETAGFDCQCSWKDGRHRAAPVTTDPPFPHQLATAAAPAPGTARRGRRVAEPLPQRRGQARPVLPGDSTPRDSAPRVSPPRSGRTGTGRTTRTGPRGLVAGLDDGTDEEDEVEEAVEAAAATAAAVRAAAVRARADRVTARGRAAAPVVERPVVASGNAARGGAAAGSAARGGGQAAGRVAARTNAASGRDEVVGTPRVTTGRIARDVTVTGTARTAATATARNIASPEPMRRNSRGNVIPRPSRLFEQLERARREAAARRGAGRK